jgi:NAD(P)-dependent dehydrogenase (short-subunit alcohol dehydrogenase family)
MENTILITGASSGIGKATAKLFLEKGWNVIASMRDPQREKELRESDQLILSKLDVLDLDSIAHTVQAGIARFGKIDVLLNNAGYGAFGPLEAFSREGIIRQINTNVIGLIDVTRALLPHFRSNKSGVIVNISSIGGKMAFPLGSLYHATKFAVEGLSEALSYELEQFGAKIKIIEPGAIATDFAGRSIDFSNNESMSEYQEIVAKVAEGMPAFFQNASPASLVAGVIYEAATDGTNKLRYTAGEDAKDIIAQRKELDDETFISGVKPMFKLS